MKPHGESDMAQQYVGTVKTVKLYKGDRVTFVYSDPHKSDKAIRIGTVAAVKGNAIVIHDDDRDAFRSFSGVFIDCLRIL